MHPDTGEMVHKTFCKKRSLESGSTSLSSWLSINTAGGHKHFQLIISFSNTGGHEVFS